MADMHVEEIEKGSRQTVRVRLLNFAGEVRCDIRVHELGDPLHHGLNLMPHRLPELIAALRRDSDWLPSPRAPAILEPARDL